MKKTIRFTLKAKGCKKEFKKGMGAGVLVYQDVEYDVTPKESHSAMFAMELINQQEAMIKEHIEVALDYVEGE